MRSLLVVLFFTIVLFPAIAQIRAIEDIDWCFPLWKEKTLCGPRSIFQKSNERDYLVSSFKTVAFMADLPQNTRVNIVRNKEVGAVIIWVSDGTALYDMAVGNSFKKAVDNLMRSLREKPKTPPFVIPPGVEKCFGKNPKPCA